MENKQKKRASGKRPTKRRFHGNRYTIDKNVSQNNKLSAVNVVDKHLSSASKRKIVNFTTNECNDANHFQGYLIMDKGLLFAFLKENCVCKSCSKPMNISEKKKVGLFSSIAVKCENCENKTNLYSSKLIGNNNNVPEINRRIVYAMRCIGQGLQGLNTFCGAMDLSSPVSQNPYDKICKHISNAVKSVAVESMKVAATDEVNRTGSNSISVSGDGTWKTRGHTSKIGVCSVIGEHTGKVIDVEVLSSTCKGCELWKGKRVGKAFEEWQESHLQNCQKNHTGSSHKMEVDGMVSIFQRSKIERGVKYINYIGDGDSKTFNAICESKPYGDEAITKLECVGHVQKRMGTRLRKLKQDYKSQKLEDGKSLSGKGRLTDVMIDKLTVYYGNAIRQNANSLDDMRKAIWSIYFHTRSSDSEPLHSFCPTGAESWCKYQRAVSAGTADNFRHQASLPPAVMDAIKPIFRALSNPDLLRRCLGSHTQNPNESFNSLIWQICPKTSGSGKRISEIAVYESAILFNDGKRGRLSVMRQLGIHPGINAITSFLRSDLKRVSSAEKAVMQSTKEARRAKKRAKISLTLQQRDKEGILYEPGGF